MSALGKAEALIQPGEIEAGAIRLAIGRKLFRHPSIASSWLFQDSAVAICVYKDIDKTLPPET